MLKRIVIIGPESTGKSTLSRKLAEYYQTVWVPEYAREYLLKNGIQYSYNDLLTVAKSQLAQEDRLAATARNKLLFVDTDMYVMKVWCEFVFDACHHWILDRITERPYDLYLLCNTDLPWVEDELREYPDLESRLRLYRMYKDIMINQHVPWTEISGPHHERFIAATRAVNAVQH